MNPVEETWTKVHNVKHFLKKDNPILTSQRPFQSLGRVSFPPYFHVVQLYLKLGGCSRR